MEHEQVTGSMGPHDVERGMWSNQVLGSLLEVFKSFHLLGGVLSLLYGLCSWHWKCVEVPLQVLQEWRRCLSDPLPRHAHPRRPPHVLHGARHWSIWKTWPKQGVWEDSTHIARPWLWNALYNCLCGNLLQRHHCLEHLLHFCKSHFQASMVNMSLFTFSLVFTLFIMTGQTVAIGSIQRTVLCQTLPGVAKLKAR